MRETWEHLPHRDWGFFRIVGLTLLGLIAATVLGLVLGGLVEWLWNLLAVPVFKLPVITYWQAVGLFVLAKLFFGSVGHGHPHGPKDRWRYARRFGSWQGPDWSGCGSGRGEAFREFWESEGRKAFEAYLDRNSQEQPGH